MKKHPEREVGSERDTLYGLGCFLALDTAAAALASTVGMLPFDPFPPAVLWKEKEKAGEEVSKEKDADGSQNMTNSFAGKLLTEKR